MKRILLILLVTIVVMTGCIPVDAIAPPAAVSTPSTAPSEVTASAVSTTISTESSPAPFVRKLMIEGKTLGNGAQYPSGELLKASYILPGYKSIDIDIETKSASIMEVFELLAQARKWDSSEKYSPLTGAALRIEYGDESQTYSFTLFTHSDGKRILVNSYPFDMTEGIGTVASEELYELIHELSGWKPFDIKQIIGIDEMKVQVEPMPCDPSTEKKGDAVVIKGDELNELVDLLVQSAVLYDDSKCPFNVSIIMLKDGKELYRGYLSGDSCPMLGLETQYFEINKEFVRRIYQKIGLDYIRE